MNTRTTLMSSWIRWSMLALTLMAFIACGGGSGSSGDSDTKQPVDAGPPPVDDTTPPPPCVPQCENKQCGDDGCGADCGSCATLETCTAAGVCESDAPQCTPNCAPGSCGDDGCGGTCACSSAEICNDATQTCEADPACNGFSFAGCCDGTKLKWCQDSEVQSADCSDGNTCGWNAEQSAYWCVEEASTDPSGTHSGVCPDCTPVCDGTNVCAADGCGGVCDTCEEGASCFDGACCTPECGDKQCGSDGCGGECGTCPAGESCAVASGQCITDPCADGSVSYEGCCDGEVLKYCDGGYKEIDCSENASCGWDPDGSYYNCGTDGSADPSGAHPLSCGPACVPACAGKVCGDDGCGGNCGTCDGTCSADGTVCTPDPCVAGESCSTGNSCEIGEVSCDAAGASTCVSVGIKPDNLSCGGGMICKNGVCVPAS